MNTYVVKNQGFIKGTILTFIESVVISIIWDFFLQIVFNTKVFNTSTEIKSR